MFSVIIPGRPCLTDIQVVATEGQPQQPTKFAFTFPMAPSFTDLVVFFLPGTILPQDTAAAIYIQFPEANTGPNGPGFNFIGAIANENPSAVFKVRTGESNTSATNANPQRSEAEEEDEMLDAETNTSASSGAMVTLGISIEPVQTVAPQLAAMEAGKTTDGTSTDLIRQFPEQRQRKEVSTKVLAQRIIGNAFNFLASFASADASRGGEEVVSLKSFRDWWGKFERRVEMDPSFLEKENPGAQG